VGIPIPSVQVGGQVQLGIPGVPQVAPAPPPQVVVVPGYGYQPPPPMVVYQQPYHQPRPMYVVREPFWGASRLGLDLRGEGAAGFGKGHATYGLGGAGIGLRYRAAPHFGVELGVDVLGGRDFNDRKRLEVAGSLGGLLYVNPRSRVQLYLSAGAMADHAKASTPAPTVLTADALRSTSTDTTFNHVGGYAGLGLEMFATRRLSFHLDARGVLRQNLTGGKAEFTDVTTGRTTNTSGGVVGSAGMVFYF
jgi:hypothetical protein